MMPEWSSASLACTSRLHALQRDSSAHCSGPNTHAACLVAIVASADIASQASILADKLRQRELASKCPGILRIREMDVSFALLRALSKADLL